ncbi:MAG TPA: shikimate dehydrogenase [Polyangiaceae bacterium]|jgi:shikimate dehydrogenase
MSQVFALLGHPVGHSLSPAIQQAAYRALGVDCRYELIDCPDEDAVRAALERLRRAELSGVNVTVPWKRVALAAADTRHPMAARVGAANVIARDQRGSIIAHNTDVPALVEEFRVHAQSLRRFIVLGNGGAALGAVAAAFEAGAERVLVTARRFDAATPETSWPHAAEFSALGARLLAWPDGSAQARLLFKNTLSQSDVVVQCTSAGMRGADSGDALASLLPWEHVPRHTLAYDLVYSPAMTPFLSGARAHGLRAENGLGMLVAQAALSIEIWLSRAVPREPLRQAAFDALAARGGA